jgi:hypothetical protein
LGCWQEATSPATRQTGLRELRRLRGAGPARRSWVESQAIEQGDERDQGQWRHECYGAVRTEEHPRHPKQAHQPKHACDDERHDPPVLLAHEHGDQTQNERRQAKRITQNAAETRREADDDSQQGGVNGLAAGGIGDPQHDDERLAGDRRAEDEQRSDGDDEQSALHVRASITPSVAPSLLERQRETKRGKRPMGSTRRGVLIPPNSDSLNVRFLESTNAPPYELCGPDASVVRAEEQLRGDGKLPGRAARISTSHRLEIPKRRHSRSVILADGLTTGRTADEVRNELIAKSTLVVHGPAPFHSRIHGQVLLAVCLPHSRKLAQAQPRAGILHGEEKRRYESPLPKVDAGS